MPGSDDLATQIPLGLTPGPCIGRVVLAEQPELASFGRRCVVYARSGRLTVPERIDEIVGVMQGPGSVVHGRSAYRGFTGLADRASGSVMGISFRVTEDDPRAAEEQGREARGRVKETGAGQGEPVVERWEVLFDEMV
jgi:hypothetical protein